MYILIALAAGLTASVLFSECWLYGRKIRFIRLGIACVLAVASYLVLSLFLDSRAFIPALLIGQTVCLLYDLISRNRQLLFPESCLFVTADMIWLPFCLSGKASMNYSVYISVIILFLTLIPMNADRQNQPVCNVTEFYDDKPKIYWTVSLIPCIAVMIDAVILAVIGQIGILLSVFLSSAFFMIFLLVLWLQKELVSRVNMKMLNDALQQWQKESRDYMNTIRSQRHDFNLHLHAVSGLINSGEYEKCRNYVQELASQAADVNDIMPVSDAVVGSMLYNMREEARRQGSDIIYHITYDMEDVLCNGFECNKIIGNLLQNAIDALQTQEDKDYGIRLSIFKRCGNTVIISENRFSGDPDRIARVFEAGYSTKKNHDGIGLSMVLRTVERYGGRVYPEFKEDKIRFIVNIPNKVNLSKGGQAL